MGRRSMAAIWNGPSGNAAGWPRKDARTWPSSPRLRRPIVLMCALYRGGRRYDVHFERLTDWSNASPDGRSHAAQQALAAYVKRLEHYCRAAPYNWFNFYDFWK